MGDLFLAYAKDLYREGKVSAAWNMANLVACNDPYCCLGTWRYAAVFRVHAAAWKRISGINWYGVLGIEDHKASPETITHQFVKLRKLIDPIGQDLDPLLAAAAVEACKLLNKAYDALSEQEEDPPLPPPALLKGGSNGLAATTTAPDAAACPRSVPSKVDHRTPPPPLKECKSTYRSSVSAVKVLSKGYRRPPGKYSPAPSKRWKSPCRSYVPSVDVISKGWYRRASPRHWKDDDRRIRVTYRRSSCRDVPATDSSFRRRSVW